MNFCWTIWFLANFSNFVFGFPIDRCKILDLTQDLSPDSPYHAFYTPFNYTKVYQGEVNGIYVEANYMCTFEHIGTHIDAPAHFAKGHNRIDKVSLSAIVGEACVIDISKKAKQNPKYLLQVDDILQWEKENGVIPDDCVLLLHSGWDKFWSDRQLFFGTKDINNPNTYKFPAFSGESAKWLVDNRKLKMIGVDVISFDAPDDHKFPAHVTFLNKDVLGIENLKNLDKLPPRGATIYAPPLKIVDGSGSPIRAFATGWDGPNDPCRRSFGNHCSMNFLLNSLIVIILLYISFAI